jgi:hypothetical protein
MNGVMSARERKLQSTQWSKSSLDDPLGFEAGDTNLFRYVGNKPTIATDPTGLAGKTVETGIKGIKLFIEWFPGLNTAEIKIMTKKGVELAIAKWILNPKTGESVCNVVATHGKKVLPGVAQSTLKKIMPKLAAEMAKNAERIGGTWVLTRLADATRTGGRLGLARPTAPTPGAMTFGTLLSAIGFFFAMENTCQAAEIPKPERLDISWEELGLTEEEIVELANAIDEEYAWSTKQIPSQQEE